MGIQPGLKAIQPGLRPMQLGQSPRQPGQLRGSFSWKWNSIALHIGVCLLHFYASHLLLLVPCVPIITNYPTQVKSLVLWSLYLLEKWLKMSKTDKKSSEKCYNIQKCFYRNVIHGQNRQVNYPHEGTFCSPDHGLVSQCFGEKRKKICLSYKCTNENPTCALELLIFAYTWF